MMDKGRRQELIEQAVKNTLGYATSLKWLLDFFDPKPDAVIQFSNCKSHWERFSDWLQQTNGYPFELGGRCHADRVRIEFARLAKTPEERI